ncbi:hypothetical protein K450DRAFT_250994 [Umbelopsis ramanniana AG]|uniref:Uncharacterized protein n=1 Tax=Umbelopsis ramanniana AG TaxID=1314678 RepID=A0AAD5HB10_UMBRA|nr:uncharacterized protein K450DRAFT_250994 [Umbelopsis ramanniana AG]KAI8577635.1 hypothetical protein K450DRAFT_250994 [Umbelopsis ramanniana AG]
MNEGGDSAHDLAQVRKLIDGMNALVKSHSKLQQQKQSGTQDSPTQPGAANSETTAVSNDQEVSADKAIDPLPGNTIIIEVAHNILNRTLYFSLMPEATIEPLISWLRVSFADPAISGMVLQYKGFDGLWKCLLNRDDSLKRILKQALKAGSMVQMRVPRAQDLLSVSNKRKPSMIEVRLFR